MSKPTWLQHTKSATAKERSITNLKQAFETKFNQDLLIDKIVIEYSINVIYLNKSI